MKRNMQKIQQHFTYVFVRVVGNLSTGWFLVTFSIPRPTAIVRSGIGEFLKTASDAIKIKRQKQKRHLLLTFLLVTFFLVNLFPGFLHFSTNRTLKALHLCNEIFFAIFQNFSQKM